MPICADNVRALEASLELVDALDAETFSEGAGAGWGGVGPHLRHILDYYACFLRDLDSGQVDYDRRERDPELETDPARARERILEVTRSLRALEQREAELAEKALDVRADAEPNEPWARSTVRRELRFLASHTIHHQALIAFLLRRAGVEPGEGFGVAPSTQKFWQGPACVPSHGSTVTEGSGSSATVTSD